jgi:hypothetical protein
MAKIDPVLVQKDISKFTDRMISAKEKKESGKAGFSIGARYDPSQWPSDDTVSLVSGKSHPNGLSYKLSTPGPKYFQETPKNAPSHLFTRERRMPDGKI